MYTGMPPCLALHGLKLCKSVSRSDLVLDADHVLDFLSDLAFQGCISFYIGRDQIQVLTGQVLRFSGLQF